MYDLDFGHFVRDGALSILEATHIRMWCGMKQSGTGLKLKTSLNFQTVITSSILVQSCQNNLKILSSISTTLATFMNKKLQTKVKLVKRRGWQWQVHYRISCIRNLVLSILCLEKITDTLISSLLEVILTIRTHILIENKEQYAHIFINIIKWLGS